MLCKAENCRNERDEGTLLCSECMLLGAIFGLGNRKIVLTERFQSLQWLESGSSCDVWKAHDVELDELVVLKILKKKLVGDICAIKNLKNEAKITRSLRHPHIVTVYDYYQLEDINFIAMEYISKEYSLANVMLGRCTPFGIKEVRNWLEQLTSALDYAHAQGVLHRNIKPANILLTRDNKVKLGIFGDDPLEKVSYAKMEGQLDPVTFAYMSPEQIMREELDNRSDIYSLAASVYELLCGHPPFYTGSVITQIQFDPVPLITVLDESVNKALQSALAKKKENRPSSTRMFFDDLCGRDVQAKKIQVIALESASLSPDTSMKAGTVRTFDGIEMVWCPPGKFTMGSLASEEYLISYFGEEAECLDSGKPPHNVILTKGFWMGKYPITQAQWEMVMVINPSKSKGGKLPVEYVNWIDCQAFIQKLNGKDRDNYRLPTEAEWEYACRAGSTAEYCFGDDKSGLEEYAWYNENSGSKAHKVGTKRPNAWGLFDMHGNVWEWCQDWYDKYPFGSVTDPAGSSSGEDRVLRGGSWQYGAFACGSATRFRETLNACHLLLDGIGFRIIRIP